MILVLLQKQAGKYWLQLFMKQNPVINLRKPEPIAAFREVKVKCFLTSLESESEKQLG
jgi:hypothetical protein